MERILLALIINHPDLFDEFGETLAQHEFQAADYEQLRQRVMDILAQAQEVSLTAAELRRTLSDHAYDPFAYEQDNSTLDEILSNDTYMHAKAARIDAPVEEARRAWVSIWETLEQGKIKADYESARARYRDHPTEENLRRQEALRERVLQFSNEEKDAIRSS